LQAREKFSISIFFCKFPPFLLKYFFIQFKWRDPMSFTHSIKTPIALVSAAPFVEIIGNSLIDLTTPFKNAATGAPKEKMAALIVGVLTVATLSFGLQQTVGRIPFYSIKKALLPTLEWSLKGGLLWLIWIALGPARDPSLREAPPPKPNLPPSSSPPYFTQPLSAPQSTEPKRVN
jgi:hypothetical protein